VGNVAATIRDMLRNPASFIHKESSMMRRFLVILLPALALSTALLGESVRARQEQAIPGVVIEELGRSPVGEEGGDELVLLRVTIEPGARLPAADESGAVVVVLEEGRAGVRLAGTASEARLTLAGGNGMALLTSGGETILAPGDAVSASKGTRLASRNAGDDEARLLYAVVTPAGGSPFSASVQDASGTFSVEMFACPEGMTLATLDMEACEPSAEPLVQWSLHSDQFEAPLGAEEATVSGATTTWQGLPSGTYFIDLIAESFAPGYSDYFIPSSNQVTRQDELTTRIFFDAMRARDSINAYVFLGDQATP